MSSVDSEAYVNVVIGILVSGQGELGSWRVTACGVFAGTVSGALPSVGEITGKSIVGNWNPPAGEGLVVEISLTMDRPG